MLSTWQELRKRPFLSDDLNTHDQNWSFLAAVNHLPLPTIQFGATNNAVRDNDFILSGYRYAYICRN